MNNDINNFYSLPGVQSDTTIVMADGGTQFAPNNAGLKIEFFIAYPPNQMETEKAGRLITCPMECVKIRQGGDDLTAAVHPVTDAIKMRFPMEYKEWELTKTNDFVIGTRLKDWPLMDAGTVQEMEFVGIRSVENLAAVSDANIARFTYGHSWRTKAQLWLAENKTTAPTKLLEAKNADLMARLEALEALISKDANPTAADPRSNPLDGIRESEFQRGRGRPRKEVAVDQPQEMDVAV